MNPPPGVAAVAGWVTWAGGCGATALGCWAAVGGARWPADGDGDRPRPKGADPRDDGDPERRAILASLSLQRSCVLVD